MTHATRVEGHPDNVAAAIHGGFVMAYGHGEGVAVVEGRVHPDLRAAFLDHLKAELRFGMLDAEGRLGAK